MADNSASDTGRESRRFETSSSRRSSTKGSRITLACTRCRQRRTKCSGLPGPCEVCKKDDEFCHFNPRMDSRRKDGLSSNDVSTRRKSILHGLLLAIVSNPEHEVQDMIRLLRSPDASPPDMARSLQRQLCIALSKSHGGAPQPTQDDLLSLVLLDALVHRKQLMKTRGDARLEQQVDGASNNGDFVGSSSVQSSQPSSTHTPEYYHIMPRIKTHGTSSTEINRDYLPFYDTTGVQTVPFVLQSSQAEFAHSYSTLFCGESSADLHTSMFNPPPGIGTTVSDLDYSMTDGDIDVHPSTSPTTYGGYEAFDIPFSPPKSDFGQLCQSLRDTGRQLLAQGTTLQDLVGDRRLNCELLFRDRNNKDAVDISNWSCEVARRLPDLPPSTRIAMALCFARVMPYLLVPCQQTYERLPLALRPTSDQLNHIHDIMIVFFPIPPLRSLMSRKHVDWLTVASRYNLTLDWLGVWGDVDGVSLTNAGNWQHKSHPLRLRKNVDFAVQIDGESSKHSAGPSKVKAITVDPSTGQRYVSDEFEAQCWIQDNWHFDENVLQAWPELGMHTDYLRKYSV